MEHLRRAARVPRRGAPRGGGRSLLLDPNLDAWNISGEQRAFLDEELRGAADARNVFVFLHQVVWTDPTRPERAVHVNSLAGRGLSVDFAEAIEPRLLALDRPVYVFAGDVGATPKADAFWYRSEGSLHLVASGMGHGERDNLVVVDVAADGSVALELVALNGDDPSALGRLEDHPANGL